MKLIGQMIMIAVLITLLILLTFKEYNIKKHILKDYQIEIKNNKVYIYDHNKQIGIVKLEGQLDSLILKNNE